MNVKNASSEPLNNEAIKEFKELYRKRFKEDISDQKAFELGNNLLNLYRVVYGADAQDLKTQEDKTETPTEKQLTDDKTKK